MPYKNSDTQRSEIEVWDGVLMRTNYNATDHSKCCCDETSRELELYTGIYRRGETVASKLKLANGKTLTILGEVAAIVDQVQVVLKGVTLHNDHREHVLPHYLQDYVIVPIEDCNQELD